MKNIAIKRLAVLVLFTTVLINAYSQETVVIKESGIADITIVVKDTGFGDIGVLFKDSGFADISVGITNNKRNAHFILKHTGFGDRSVVLKSWGIADISILTKDFGFADVSILITKTGFADYLIYSDKEEVTNAEIIAALVEVIKAKAKDKRRKAFAV
ncbi:MAG: hypothetical protein LBG19_07430 [Prevotellaceae bacterium]|jgi:hypothetical protein|nr:hypothetical protein [Prevotellaceae bacterium]